MNQLYGKYSFSRSWERMELRLWTLLLSLHIKLRWIARQLGWFGQFLKCTLLHLDNLELPKFLYFALNDICLKKNIKVKVINTCIRIKLEINDTEDRELPLVNLVCLSSNLNSREEIDIVLKVKIKPIYNLIILKK